MPLSEPSPRQPLHTRKLTFEGYLRDDGLFDIEGHLVDTKPFDFENTDRGGWIRQGESLHEMRIRVTIDKEMRIQAAEAETEWSPFNTCPGGADTFSKLAGVQIGPGWNRKVRELIGGVNGCTHITEMLAQLATTAYQAMYSVRREEDRNREVTEKPPIIDTCHALRSDGPIVLRQWPQFYDGPDAD